MNPATRAKLQTLPAKPGVYLFRNGEGEVIYVGKANSLRERVRSYFLTPPDWDRKGHALRGEMADLEVTVCGSEVDALILEATLIKKHRPRFNVILRDDKSYPYIAVTVSEEYPRVALMRGKKVRGVRYYGPYVSARAPKNTIRLLRKVFPIRQCTGREPGGRGRSPCIYHEMEMCLGPCTGKVDPDEYLLHVKSFCDFLEGRHKSVIEDLDRRMREASREQEYEQAARLRNQIASANRVLSHHRALSSSEEDYDVIGVFADDIQACFAVAQNRGGVHLGNLCFFTDLEVEMQTEELVPEFMKRYYDQAGSIPEQVLIPAMPEDEQALASWLAGQRGGTATIRVPRRGKKRSELSLASSNARLALEGANMERSRDKTRVKRALSDLAGYLGLERYPLRIECYDISTMGGTASVASMVVFQDGYPDRRDYRRFMIKFTPGVDDVGMMKEVLYRRFKRLKRAGELQKQDGRAQKRSGFERSPDLVLLDGGWGQLGAGVEVLKVLKIEDIEVAALAKRLEEVYRPGHDDPIVIPRGSEALFLMQRVRDEAHRVAVSYHRSLMRKSTAESWLDRVAGVGPARKKALIRHFGSPARLSRASLKEIESVPGIPREVALAVSSAVQTQKEARGVA